MKNEPLCALNMKNEPLCALNIKKKHWRPREFTANYNWKYVFKSHKTNMEVPNALSFIKFLGL